MRQQPQLELPIVSNNQRVALLRDERISDFVLVLLEGGLVLQVGSSGGQAAGLGVEVQAAVDALLVVHEGLQ